MTNRAPDKSSIKLKVKYEELSAKYANQVVLNASAEEIYLDFSSGVIPDPATGEHTMPIHTRIAMSHNAARRLSQALQQALSRSSSPAPSPEQATLPPLKVE
ncbi:MAG: DUF3467 domain-containing protein [Verrucomicrobiia bacterium]